MGTPLSHGWQQQLQGLKRDRPRPAGPTSGGSSGGQRSRAGGQRPPQARAPLGLPCPTPAGPSRVRESPGASSSHAGCSCSCLLLPHEPPALPESTVPSPPARSPSQPAGVQLAPGQAAAQELPDSVSPCLDQGISFTFLQVCWAAAEPLVTGSQWERPAGSHGPLGDGPVSFPEQQDEDPFIGCAHG